MKKKFMILSTIVFGLVIGLYNINENEVKADTTNKCQTYTNYYLLLAANGKDDFITHFENSSEYTIGPFSKDFSLGLLNTNSRKYGEGVVALDHDTVDNGTTSMSLEKFHELYVRMGPNEVYSDGTTYYIRNNDHVNTEDENIQFVYDIPTDYDEFKALVPEDIETIVNINNIGSKSITLEATRTWEESGLDWESVPEEAQVYSPAVYYVQYEACTYDVNVELIDKATGDLIDEEIAETGLKTGATYEYTCPTDVEGYELSDTDEDSFEGEIEEDDVTLQCYYTKTKEPQKHTLTVNFSDSANCSNGSNLKTAENYTYTEGDDVTYKIPEIDKYEFSEVGSVTPTFNYQNKDNKLTFDMPSKNTSICLVYIKNSQTGTGWIYFAWIIALLALSYSGWYFVKYYKTRNNEI